MITVTQDFVEQALQARYDDVVDTWGDTASKSLWVPFLEYLLDAQELTGTPSEITDNFLVNGDFTTRLETQTQYQWDSYCATKAIVYNSEYALINKVNT